VDVTPTEFPFNMPGNFGEHIAGRVHDPFHVRASVGTYLTPERAGRHCQ
jgi:neutral ceramidase